MERQYLLRRFPPPPAESPRPPRASRRRFRFSLGWSFGRTPQVSISLEGPDMRMVAVRGDRVVGWHETTLPSRLISNGMPVAGVELGQQIRRFLHQEGLPTGHLRLAFPGLQSITRVLEVPTSVHANLDSLVKREARRLLQPSPDSYLRWQRLPTRRGNPSQQIYLVMMPRGPLNTTLESLDNARLKVSTVDLKPLAVARAVNARDGIIAHSDLRGGDVVVVVGGIPMFIHSFYWGDEPVAPEYAPMRLVDHLTRTIHSYNDNHREQPLDPNVPVYLTGPLAEEEGLATTVVNITRRQVATPMTPLRFPPNFPVQAYMACLGMALKRN